MTRCRPPSHLRFPSPPGDLAIGVMGGSFDPPHSGHAHVIETARRAAGLDRVWVFVAAGNPLKRTQTAFIDRLAAAQRCLGGRRITVTGLEQQLGLRYTIDLLRRLKRSAPGARFVWIMGADNLRDFHRWKSWQAIAKLAPILVIARPGASPKAGLSRFATQFGASRLPQSASRTLAYRKPPAWVYIAAPLDPVSSSLIRAQTMATAIAPI
ncbi:MAG: nicotinate (nicotinamide) nucleotide adenylyltransferase [Hyphomonadaceae bacterium]